MMVASNIALYIGAPIEEESERMVLCTLLTTLTERNVPVVVLANFHVGGRQLDFVVGTDQTTLVAEAKASSLPLRGQYNGEWSVRTRHQGWKPIRNAYQQALQAKNALRDAMRTQDDSLSGYPDACVIFVPNLPPGSDLAASDYKVSFCGLDELAAQTEMPSSLGWSLDCWRRFAEAHRLERVSHIEHAFDARLREAHRTLERYSIAFSATYVPLVASHVPDTYVMDAQDCGLEDVEAALVNDREDLLILGPSGCGKSLLALCLANRLLARNVVPLILECKSFNGKLSVSLDREAALLDMRSSADLMAAARSLSRQIAVVVDGYNECPEGSKVQLTRALRAVSGRNDAMIVVSSQTSIARPDLLRLRQVGVVAPTSWLKARIAKVDASGDTAMDFLLDTVSTGIEADLVGQVGREISLSSSRFALFDFFVRRRLGESAIDGIRLLCAISERLMQRVTFSLSVREVDRIQVEAGLSTSTLARVQRSGVLTVRGDRVSFCHEMYLNVFAAEAIIRRAGSNAGAILTALATPQHRAVRAFVIGAIDDESLQEAVLSAVSQSDLLEACISGECGSAARRIVTNAVTALPAKLEKEVDRLRFKIVVDGWWNVEVDPESLTTWSDYEKALLSILAVGLAEGRLVKEVLGAVRHMDATLASEFRRLRPEAVDKRINIRSSLFAVAYMFGQATIGFAGLISALHAGSHGFRKIRSTVLPAELKLVWHEADSAGVLYLALALSRAVYEVRGNFAGYALPFLQSERWKFLPYHVQLDLLDFVHAVNKVSDEIRNRLISSVQALLPDLHPLMTRTALEALSRFGALQAEEDEHVVHVREQIQDLLDSPTSEHTPAMTWNLYSAQFEHPFASAYVQAIEELSVESRLSLLRLACAGANSNHFFLSTVFDQLSEAGDLLAAPLILRWTDLPSQQSSWPQHSIETFISAFVALGKLGINLPAEICKFGCGACEDALIACGLLYYWIQRRHPATVLEEAQAAAALDILLRPKHAVAAGVLYEISHSMFDSIGSSTALVHAFPEQVLEICREALEMPDRQAGYFDRKHNRVQPKILNFAVNVVGTYGSASDLARLRLLIENPNLANAAMEAVKTIEAREGHTGAS